MKFTILENLNLENVGKFMKIGFSALVNDPVYE